MSHIKLVDLELTSGSGEMDVLYGLWLGVQRRFKDKDAYDSLLKIQVYLENHTTACIATDNKAILYTFSNSRIFGGLPKFIDTPSHDPPDGLLSMIKT